MPDSAPFYETKSLREMTQSEWESLCDGCGKCCVVLLQEEAGGEVFRTNVACALLDLKAVRCTDYDNRHARVPSCVALSPDNIGALSWMPDTCAYRVLHEGRPLPDWHPLKTGDSDSVVRAGVSVHGSLVSEADIDPDDLEDHIIEE
jgi:uncharacterized cysteine cluster protein YcgN (CxxCxxCC family)